MSKEKENNTNLVKPQFVKEQKDTKEELKESKKIEKSIKDEFYQEKEVVKVKPKAHYKGKVIYIIRDGCIAENLKQPGENRTFLGAKYKNKKIGDIIEFDY